MIVKQHLRRGRVVRKHSRKVKAVSAKLKNKSSKQALKEIHGLFDGSISPADLIPVNKISEAVDKLAKAGGLA